MKKKLNPVSQRRYFEMFKGLIAAVKEQNRVDLTNVINEMIKDFRKTLHTDEQKIWILRGLRAYYFNYYGFDVDKEWNKFFSIETMGHPESPAQFKATWYINFQHFFETAKRENQWKILNLKFTGKSFNEIYHDLTRLEVEYQRKNKKQYVEMSLTTQGIFLDLSKKWAWFYEELGYCDQTAKVMGHCGNNPSYKDGDILLNLGEKIDENKYIPHLTFILNNGILGERKGPHNSKPSKEYYKYIIPLLLDERIIWLASGAGYLSENNFELKDLSSTTQTELKKMKPSLFNYKYLDQRDLRKLVDPQLHDFMWNSLYSYGFTTMSEILSKSEDKKVPYKFNESLDWIVGKGDLWKAFFVTSLSPDELFVFELFNERKTQKDRLDYIGEVLAEAMIDQHLDRELAQIEWWDQKHQKMEPFVKGMIDKAFSKYSKSISQIMREMTLTRRNFFYNPETKSYYYAIDVLFNVDEILPFELSFDLQGQFIEFIKDQMRLMVRKTKGYWE